MPQRSPGDAHGDPAGNRSPPKNSSNSTSNPSIHHSIHPASTSKYQIHKRLEGFWQEIRPINRLSQTTEKLEDGVPMPELLCSGKKSSREQAASRSRSRRLWAPSASRVADQVESHNALHVARWPGARQVVRSYAQVVRDRTSPRPAASLVPASTNLSHGNPQPHESQLSPPAAVGPCFSPVHQSVQTRRGCSGDNADGWQLVTQRNERRKTRLQPTAGSNAMHQDPLRRAFYLSKVRGKCFNCLASGHRVAQCRNLTKCWVCEHSGHISYGCPSRQSATHSSQHWTSPSSNSIPPDSGHSLVDTASPELLLGPRAPPVQLLEPTEDPMWLEAELACRQLPRTGSDQDRVVLESHSSLDVMATKLQDTPAQALVESVKLGDEDLQSSEVAQEHPEDSQTPLLIRSEEEQHIRHQLIKALSNFKHNAVAPLSSPNIHASFDKETIISSTKGNQCRSQNPKYKIKSQKPVIKVVLDMLTKKWIFVRRDKQLGDLTLNHLSANNFEAFKKLSEMAMFMEAIRQLAGATEKRKKSEF